MPYAVHRKSQRTNKSRLSRFATRAFAVCANVRFPVAMPRRGNKIGLPAASVLSRSFNQFRTPRGRISIFTYRGKNGEETPTTSHPAAPPPRPPPPHACMAQAHENNENESKAKGSRRHASIIK